MNIEVGILSVGGDCEGEGSGNPIRFKCNFRAVASRFSIKGVLLWVFHSFRALR